MAFFEPYLDMWRNYANFNGRTSLRGYWMAILGAVIASFAVGIISLIPYVGPVVYSAYVLACIVPGISLVIRRLHDIGKSGWYYFFAFIPFAGFIILIIWFCQPSVGDNQYGPMPQA